MIIKVMSVPSIESSADSDKNALGSFKVLSGRAASVCYMEDCSIANIHMPESDAERLSDKVFGRGHSSIGEHYNISLYIQGISKLLAMILNSFQVYSTSERSGRYTIMTGNTAEEVKLYTKWLGIFKKLILENNPSIKSETLETRARENARYVLSVLTHDTTMVYTTNVRQWNAVLLTLTRYMEYIRTHFVDDEFYISFAEELEDFVHNVGVLVGFENFVSNSIPSQDMFTMFSDTHFMRKCSEPFIEHFDITYATEYEASYAQIAHIQRHRAIKYFIVGDLRTDKFYIPQIIRGIAYEREWLADLSCVADLVPQATMLKVREMGCLTDFLHKCDERICARVMLETLEQCVDTLKKYKSNSVGMISSAREVLLNRFNSDGEPRLKCEMRGGCKESCKSLGVSGTPLYRKV